MEMGKAPTTTGVRVVSVSRVAPSSPAQQPARVKLSCLDVSWVWLPAVQHLFLYELDPGDDAAGAGIPARLKAALADTLTHYLPLAGRLEYEVDTGDLVVDCSDAGVAFIEAVADGMDVRRLAHDEARDMPAFVSLVPELDARVLPAPVLSVQVTRLGVGACGGGLAVGLSMHHAVADGRAMWQFVEAWASCSSRGGAHGLRPAIYRRDAIVHYPRPDELAREWLKIMAPNLPVVSSSRDEQTANHLLRLARWTFHLGADGIRALKRRIDDGLAAATTPRAKKPVSTFVALAALGWTAFVRSKGLGAGDDTYLMYLADLRPRLDPPVADEACYLGNCVMDCVARCADAAEIAGGGEAGILHAARAVLAAVAVMEAAPLLPAGHGDALSDLPMARLVNLVGSPRFQGYKVADFGFGSPALVEAVSMNHDGEMMLIAGRRDGEVQLSVAIHPDQMAAYKACILEYLVPLPPNLNSRI